MLIALVRKHAQTQIYNTTEKVGTDNSVKGNAKYRYNEIANVFGIPKQIEQVIFEDWEAIAMLIEEKLQSKEVR